MSDTYTPFAPIKYDQAAVARQGWGVAASGPSDDQMTVGFYRKDVINAAKSREAGKPVYESRDYVKISHPGEANLQVTDVPVNENHVQRFPRQWAQYQNGVQQVPDGVPITLLFPAHPHIATTLRGYNIHTVEQLANLSAQGISSIGMGALDWVNGAKRYMERASKGVDHHKFETMVAAKDQEIATLKRQMQELTQLVHSRNQTPPNPQNYDFQTAQINQTHASADDSQALLQAPAQFVQDLSGQVTKRRGRPPGSANKPKGD